MNNSCENKESPKDFKNSIKSKVFIKNVIGISVGAIAGYLYYAFEGCKSGSCGVLSNPYSSIIFGAFTAFFLLNRPCKTC